MSENPNSFDLNGTEAPPPGGGSDNRGFILVVSILGALFLLALIVMAVFVVIVLPRNRAGQATQAAQIVLNNKATISGLTQAATLAIKSVTPIPPTLTFTPTASATVKPSSTPVLAVATNTFTATLIGGAGDPRTATVSALLTQAFQAKQTGTPGTPGTPPPSPTATGLPKTGFAEDASIPTLLGLTLLLIVIIFVVRRLRTSTPA